MQLLTDHELLRAYAYQDSEAAFAQLVERHLPLVWSAARRQMPDAQQAEDVAQQVFALLAQKAASLGGDVILPGWLYRATSFVAARALRGEHRRREREHSAMIQMNEASSPSPWSEIEPMLDRAMTELNETDRDAVVMRYFQNKSLHEVGAALGTNEDAAQKRLARAVEKLRVFFTRHGKSVTAGTLTTALATGAIQSAPATLAASISVLALSSATTTGTSILSLMSGAALKTTITATAGLAAAIAVFLQQQRVAELRTANESLQAQLRTAEAASVEQASRFQAANPQRDAEARQIQSELLRLRGEVSQLRQRLKDEQAARRSAPTNQTDAVVLGELPPEVPVVNYEATVTSRIGLDQTLAIGGWLLPTGNRCVVFVMPKVNQVDGGTTVDIQTRFIELPEDAFVTLGLDGLKADGQRSSSQLIMDAGPVEAILEKLKQWQGVNLLSAPRITSANGRQARISMENTRTVDGVTFKAGPSVDVVPTIAADGSSIDLTVVAQLRQPLKVQPR